MVTPKQKYGTEFQCEIKKDWSWPGLLYFDARHTYKYIHLHVPMLPIS